MRVFAACLIVLSAAWSAAETVSGGVFTIHFDPLDRAIAADTLETSNAFAAEMFGRLPTGDAPINIVICGTVAEFVERAGEFGRADIAGIASPSEGVILLKSPRILGSPVDYDGVLRHEIVHVLLARNVNTDNLPGWLNEGMCMYLSREHRWASSWRVAQMYTAGGVFSYYEMEFAFNDGPGERPFGDIYAQSLSMTRHLIDTHGEETLWAIVNDLDTIEFRESLEKYTGWTTVQFHDDWTSSLWTGALATSVISGVTIFQIGAVLLFVAWLRKRRAAAGMLAEMEDDENEPLAPWEVPLEQDPYEWEHSDDEEDW